MAITNITPSLTPPGINDIQDKSKVNPKNNPQGLSFDQMLDSLSKTQSDSDLLMQKLAAGEDVDLHQVMIASEETDISFRVALAIRDKLVDAYRQVTTMPV